MTGDMARPPALVLTSFPQRVRPQPLLPSGNPSHASPATRHDAFPQQALYGDNSQSALQSMSHVPENRAEKRGDSHRFWFFGEELFFAENGA